MASTVAYDERRTQLIDHLKANPQKWGEVKAAWLTFRDSHYDEDYSALRALSDAIDVVYGKAEGVEWTLPDGVRRRCDASLFALCVTATANAPEPDAHAVVEAMRAAGASTPEEHVIIVPSWADPYRVYELESPVFRDLLDELTHVADHSGHACTLSPALSARFGLGMQSDGKEDAWPRLIVGAHLTPAGTEPCYWGDDAEAERLSDALNAALGCEGLEVLSYGKLRDVAEQTMEDLFTARFELEFERIVRLRVKHEFRVRFATRMSVDAEIVAIVTEGSWVVGQARRAMAHTEDPQIVLQTLEDFTGAV